MGLSMDEHTTGSEHTPATDADIRILLVDDEEDLIATLERHLVRKGSFPRESVFTASGGKAAIEMFNKAHPDIVVTDLRMPDLSGHEVIEAIRQQSADTEIVVMTAYADLQSTTSLFKWNVSEFIQKPFDFEQVRKFLEKIKARIDLKRQNAFLTRRLFQAEKLSSIGLLSSGVAHEINNPNAFVKGNLEIIQAYTNKFIGLPPEKEQAPETVQAALQTMKEIAVCAKAAIRGTDRITLITSSLLRYCRNAPHSRESISVGAAIQDSLEILHYRTKMHELMVTCPEDLPFVFGNAAELVEVFPNLIVNAIDAIEERLGKSESGKLQIEARNEPSTEQVIVEITDNGAGIPAQIAEKLFDPFFTTKPIGKGTGLGLSIVKGIVESHGATITFESQVNQGTKCLLKFPWAAKERARNGTRI